MLKNLLLCAIVAIVVTSDIETTENFERDSGSELKERWSFLHTGSGAPGDWSTMVEEDKRHGDASHHGERTDADLSEKAKPTSDNHVLAQRDDSKSKDRTHLAIRRNRSYTNVRISARVRIIDGDDELSAGVVWRVKDKNNYLLARIDAKDERVRLYRVVNGNRIRFGGMENIEIERRRWYTIRIEHVGDKIKFYLNDDIVAMETDRHFRNAGGVGFWTKSDSVAYFDDLKITPIEY